jgi:hypothetical protein
VLKINFRLEKADLKNRGSQRETESRKRVNQLQYDEIEAQDREEEEEGAVEQGKAISKE